MLDLFELSNFCSSMEFWLHLPFFLQIPVTKGINPFISRTTNQTDTLGSRQ